MKIQIDGEELEFEIKNFNSDSRIHFILKGDCGAIVISYWRDLDSLDLNIHSHKPYYEGLKMQTKAQYNENKGLIKLWIKPSEELFILKMLTDNNIEVE